MGLPLALTSLDELIEIFGVKLGCKLRNPPVSDACIAHVEASFGVSLPDEPKDSLHVTDGSSQRGTEDHIYLIEPGYAGKARTRLHVLRYTSRALDTNDFGQVSKGLLRRVSCTRAASVGYSVVRKIRVVFCPRGASVRSFVPMARRVDSQFCSKRVSRHGKPILYTPSTYTCNIHVNATIPVSHLN